MRLANVSVRPPAVRSRQASRGTDFLSLDKIAFAHYSDELAVLHYGQGADIVLNEQLGDVFDKSVGSRRHQTCRHNVMRFDVRPLRFRLVGFKVRISDLVFVTCYVHHLSLHSCYKRKHTVQDHWDSAARELVWIIRKLGDDIAVCRLGGSAILAAEWTGRAETLFATGALANRLIYWSAIHLQNMVISTLDFKVMRVLIRDSADQRTNWI